jgi:hypothetical protein
MAPAAFFCESEFSSWCDVAANLWSGSDTSFAFPKKRLHRSVKITTVMSAESSEDNHTLLEVCALCLDDCIGIGINEQRSFESFVSSLRKQIDQIAKKTNREAIGLTRLDRRNRESVLPFQDFLEYELPNGCYLLTKKSSIEASIARNNNKDRLLKEYTPAAVTLEPCFRVIDSLPETTTLIRHLKLSKEVFILQNRLTQMSEQCFSEALMHAVESNDISFKCTLYHPESRVAYERETELGENLRLWIRQCIEQLHTAMRASLTKAGKSQFENCEFRIALEHLPYTIYGFDNRIYLGWLVHGRQSNAYHHIVLQGPNGAFEVVKKFFDSFWNNSAVMIDLAKPIASLLALPQASSRKDTSTYREHGGTATSGPDEGSR